LNRQEEKGIKTECFTDFGGKFHARLAAVIPRFFSGGDEAKTTGTSARYSCRVKIEYQRDLMGLLEEGMLLASRNFKHAEEGVERYTLMEISRVWPEHFGLRGLSDHGYYPMQFEIIEQSEEDWQTDDKSTMMIQIDAVPINYDLKLGSDCNFEFSKGFSYPVVGSPVFLLNSDMINRMYNKRITDLNKIDVQRTTQDARLDPRLGTIKMFQADQTVIPIYVDFEKLVRYHFGVFAFTGGGKSNLTSNILRRILLHTQKNTKVVLFDLSCEYAFLLLDLIADPLFPAKIILEHRIDSVEQLYNSIVKPREYEYDERVKVALKQVMEQGKVGYYTKPKQKVPTYSQFMDELNAQRKDSIEKPHYINAIDEIHDAVLGYMEENGASEAQEVNETFVEFIDPVARESIERFKVHEKSGLYAWGTTRTTILDIIRRKSEKEKLETTGLTAEKIRRFIEEESTRLLCVSISDPFVIKELVISLTQELLARRKRKFQVKPYILLAFDEAQEFIPATGDSGGIDKKCSRQVETILRQGRKYGIGVCVSTQRIANLNTNALQQLHTYFVGTLPRPYDRMLISDTFMIDKGILEKTLEFSPGEWLLSSYIATGIENVPIFIKADNAENEVEKYLKSITSS
jgi:DNA helicase HerA-like ATPase